MVATRIDHARGHGFTVLKHHESKLGAFHGEEICVSDACTIATIGFHHLNVEFAHILASKFSVQNISLNLWPCIIAPARLTGFNHEGRCGLCDIVDHGRQSVNTVLAGRRLEGVLAVRWMQGKKGDS